MLSLCIAASCTKIEQETKAVSATNTSAVSDPSKPNIILILGDDVGYEIPTCNGGQSYLTPNIDQMAAEGMRYTQCHSTPICSPSRTMLVSGKYSFRNYTAWGKLDTTSRTFANMLKDAGYRTCVAGKWQLDGGDASIRAFGFDNYSVYNPFTGTGDEKDGGSRYKNPTIYQNGAILSSNITKGKYGDDLFLTYIQNFINGSGTNPFFVYFPICLVHPPMSPTPDDPQFATWNSPQSDPSYFPSMVKYMDKKIGELINFVKTSPQISNNTVIIYVGDNGTVQDITSMFLGQPYQGGKTKTTEAGTHVPMIAWWPGKIAAGSVNKDLVDFTDFMPTFADIANIAEPTDYGTLDGVSFYPRMVGLQGTPRPWIFCHYHPMIANSRDINKTTRWVQDSVYKLYDSTFRFYNIKTDPLETKAIKPAKLTPEQLAIQNNFKAVLLTMH